jgi:hypothetical protein
MQENSTEMREVYVYIMIIGMYRYNSLKMQLDM